MTPMKLFNKNKDLKQCPCCDYFTLTERGAYEICLVCFWEDDGNDINKLDRHSGPNHQTLRQARENFVKTGACDKNSLKSVLAKKKLKKYKFEKRLE